MNAFDLIITATATGFGVCIGQFMFEQIKQLWKKHKENAQKVGEKIGSGINKTFIQNGKD